MERTEEKRSNFIGGVTMENTKQAIFKLGEEAYGMDIMAINSVEKPLPVEKVANSPVNMKGVINLRDEKIPVYSLRKKFGLDEKEVDEDTRLIITSSNGISIAYEVDKMDEIITLESEHILDAPPLVMNTDTSYIKAIVKNNDCLVILMDIDGILTKEEQNTIKAIIKK